MPDAFAQFEKRLENLERKHKELAAGYVAQINPDGLITVAPKPKRSGLTLRLIAMLVIGVILFKVVTLSLVGPVVYQGRVDQLASGTAFEKAAAWIMQLDPFSLQASQFLSGLMA
ncbi:MAG: hypothetical protein AAGF27_11565 [Pseudomonadota bacterium]